MDFLAGTPFAEFHFLRPALLLALIPALLLFLGLLYARNSTSAWTRAIDPALLPYLLDNRRSSPQNRNLFGVLALWILATLALAGPVWERLPVPVQENEDALVVVMDLSLSMNATDVNPSRTVRARRKLLDVLNARREEGLTALVVYAGDAHAVTPLTDDVETIRNLAPALAPEIMPVLGSDPSSGVRLALELLANASISNARILLLTDGLSPADADSIAGLLASSSHELGILGIGTEQGSPIPVRDGGFLRDARNAIVIPRLERAILQDLAARSGGRYADARLDDGDIDYLLETGRFAREENLVESEREFDYWYEAGPWLLLLILPFAAAAFRQGWLLSVGLCVILLPAQQAKAFEWEDLWKNRNQQAGEEFSEERYGEAASQFKDPRWKASAWYRAGEYERAVEELSGLDEADAHYNRGNALAHLNRLQEAISAYDRALELQPDHADAEKNRRLVESLLQQQQQEQQQNQQGSGDQQEQQQEQQEGEQQNQDGEPQQSDSEQQQQNSQQQQEQDPGSEQQQQQEQEQEQQQDEGEQQEQESEQSEQEEERDASEQQPSEGNPPDAEAEQSIQQWLRRIEDDPGELLRNKFEYQTLRRLREQLTNPNQPRPPEAEEVW